MYFAISNILPIFLTIFMGKLIRWKWLSAIEFWKGLEKLSYYILFPVVLFNYISTADLQSEYLNELLYGLAISTVIISIFLIFFQIRTNFDKKKFTSIFQGSIRYNSYIFFGLADALYGSEGMQVVSIIAAHMIIFTNILTVLVFSYYSDDDNFSSDSNNLILRSGSKWKLMLKNMATNPLILSSLMGFIANYTDLVPGFLMQKFLISISDSAFTMGLLCVGANLRFDLNLRDGKLILLTSCIKLLIMPLLTYLILIIMGIKGMLLSVGILYSSLPTASNSFLLSKQLGGDPDSMATILTFTIILSIFTISIVTLILT